jgi:hypothetical protein
MAAGNQSNSIDLKGLAERHSGLTPSLAGTYAEAASVCFARFYASPVTLTIKHGSDNSTRELVFQVPDQRTYNAHANEIDATEAGAYGVSLAAIDDVSGLVAVRRTETLTGADWYVAPHGSTVDDLEDCFLLEVSGVSGGNSADVQRRLRQKIDQTKRGTSNLPAIAAVVGFNALEVAITQMEDHR